MAVVYNIGSRGPNVEEIQSLLNWLNFNAGTIDGIYGSSTAAAVRRFQSFYGLPVTGVVDDNTYRVLLRLLEGYDIYTIRPGDTLYFIAQRYYTPLSAILIANPGVDPNMLQIGQKIIVPYSINVVDTRIDYTYEIMNRDIKGLKARYPFIDVEVPGKSVLGKNLYLIKLGNGPNKVFYNGAHHANEWITSVLLMKFIENYAKAYAFNGTIEGQNIRDLWKKNTIYIMPMVNPDGVDLVIEGPKRSNPYYNDLIKWNKGSTDFSSGWSANIRGVDLNHNYDASWQQSKEAEKELGIFGPAPRRYSGPAPESEPETKTVVRVTRDNNFKLVIAYHTQGRVIYWDYKNMASTEARRIAEVFARMTGYRLAQPTGITSYSGYKDWFIEKFRKPGYTIEVGLGENPIPISQFKTIYNNNIEVLVKAPNV